MRMTTAAMSSRASGRSAAVPPDLDPLIQQAKQLLQSSTYVQERFDQEPAERFADELDIAATILVNSIFHDLLFNEEATSFSGFFDWLVQHYPRESTPPAVYGIVRGLRQQDPLTYQTLLRKLRPGLLTGSSHAAYRSY